MRHFVEQLLNREYDLCQEVIAIESLFYRQNGGHSIYDKVLVKFIDWDLRNNYIDFNDFLLETGLVKIVEKCHRQHDISLEEYIYYCEYMCNILCIPGVGGQRFVQPIVENIINVLTKLNYKTHQSGNVFHIIENDVLVSEAADIVQTNYDLGEGIYSFNYRETKGDIVKKADILCRLYKYIESVTPQAKQYGFETMLDDIKDLMNKLDVRHAATEKQAAVIDGMDASEYENWIDDLFRLSLSLIILVDYRSKRKDIKELKSMLG